MITLLGLTGRTPEFEAPQLLSTAVLPPARSAPTGAIVASAVAHLLGWALLAALWSPPSPIADTPAAPPRVTSRVFLPPLEPPSRSAARPEPVKPADAGLKQRVSVGVKSDQRMKELLLRRDDDLTKVARGDTRQVVEAGPLATRTQPTQRNARSVPPATGVPGHAASPAPRSPAVPEPWRRAEPPPLDVGRAVARALESTGSGTWGDAQGTLQGVGPLQFDPQGADFTRWVQHFKDEVYRNWILPQSVRWGLSHGDVGFVFMVERDGSISSLDAVRSSGTPALDRAAANALRSSMLLPLPDDYGPRTIVMRIVFTYHDRRSARSQR